MFSQFVSINILIYEYINLIRAYHYGGDAKILYEASRHQISRSLSEKYKWVNAPVPSL